MPSTSLRVSRLTAVAAASGATNWLNNATWRLFDSQGNLSPLVTATRSGTATFFNSSGVLQNATANTPRVSYDPANLSLGPFLLAEEARTNGIRNNTMQGAVAGTPGTLPTNWEGSEAVDGLSRSIIGMPVVNGIQCVDIRFSGTSGTSASVVLIAVEGGNTVAATSGQRWTSSSYLALVGGSLDNVTLLQMRQRFNNSSGGALAVVNTTISGITGQLQRYVASGTTSNTSTAFVNFTFTADFANNLPVNFTLRIGLPQLELGATASSPIPTSGTAVTRSADNLSVTNLTATGFNASEGTLYVDAVAQKLFSSCAMSLTDGTSNNRIDLFRYDGAGGNPGAVVVSGGSNQAVLLTPISRKFALAYKQDDFTASADGSITGSDTSGVVPVVTTLHIGQRNAGNDPWVGHIYQAAIIPQRVPDSGLQRLTRI